MLGSRYFSKGFYICLNSDEITAYMYVFNRQRETMSHCRTFKIKTLLKTFLRVHKQAKTGTLLKEGADLLQHLDM